MLNSVIAFFLVVSLSTFGSSLPHLDGRIVGGDPISISKTPYQVSLQLYGQHFCGGSLIALDWVLTASHCFQDINEFSVVQIRAGSSSYNRGGQLITVEYIIKHDDYDDDSLANDIALVKLAEKVNISETVNTISLATNESSQGSRGYISGWGHTSEFNKLIPKLLNGVEVAMISHEVCEKIYAGIDIFNYTVCAFTFGKDSCQGDSGGPLVVNNKQSGIVSWGDGCGLKPGIYTSVPAFIDWINLALENFS